MSQVTQNDAAAAVGTYLGTLRKTLAEQGFTEDHAGHICVIAAEKVLARADITITREVSA